MDSDEGPSPALVHSLQLRDPYNSTIGENDTSFEAFYTTAYINLAIGLIGFLFFSVLRPLKALGFRQFFAPVCYTARNRAALEKEAEARRHGRPYGSPGATAVASYLSDTACYPFHSGLFGWVMPTLRYAPTLCGRSRYAVLTRDCGCVHRYSDAKLIATHGLDAVMYFRFLRLSMFMVLALVTTTSC